MTPPSDTDAMLLSYIVGVALGDGNLSNPNGRATKLRVTCDLKYPAIQARITHALQALLPNNKVGTVARKGNCLDIYCYSNKLEGLLGWKVGHGSKFQQRVRVPEWIKSSENYIKPCLKGLFETDGSIYIDRGYKMVNFVTIIPELAADVMQMTQQINFLAHCYRITQRPPHQTRFNIRISKNTEKFIQTINLQKN